MHICAALQFWTPTILAERGVRDLRTLGLASAVPWAVIARSYVRLLVDIRELFALHESMVFCLHESSGHLLKMTSPAYG